MNDTQESPFWRFSLNLYRQEGVPAACLTLQDACSVDVNILLYGLWLAAHGRELSVADLDTIDSASRSWRHGVVVPLRHVRRFLKEPEPAFADEQTRNLREKIKAVELESERLQQERLSGLREPATWGKANPDLEAAANLNMKAYADVLVVEFDEGAQSAMLAGMRALAASGKLP